jgi:hypothetical protein
MIGPLEPAVEGPKDHIARLAARPHATLQTPATATMGVPGDGSS